MKDELSFDDFDEKMNPRPELTDFDVIVENAISRRGFLGGTLACCRVGVTIIIARSKCVLLSVRTP